MTAIEQQKPERVDEHFMSIKLINPTKKIKDATLQTLIDLYKDKLGTNVADVVIEPTIKECKGCTTKLKST